MIEHIITRRTDTERWKLEDEMISIARRIASQTATSNDAQRLRTLAAEVTTLASNRR